MSETQVLTWHSSSFPSSRNFLTFVDYPFSNSIIFDQVSKATFQYIYIKFLPKSRFWFSLFALLDCLLYLSIPPSSAIRIRSCVLFKFEITFLKLRIVSAIFRTHWTRDHPDARSLPTQANATYRKTRTTSMP